MLDYVQTLVLQTLVFNTWMFDVDTVSTSHPISLIGPCSLYLAIFEVKLNRRYNAVAREWRA